MGKEGKIMRKTVEKRRDFDIKQWKKMGKQWKILVERLENCLKREEKRWKE